MSFIYCFTNKVTGKKYVGQAANPQSRRNAHKCCALKRNSPYYFHKSIRKHGWDNFEFQILEETDNPNEVETKYIVELNTHWPHGYNELVEHGGMPDITKQKISITKKAQWLALPEEEKEKRRKQSRIANLGNSHSDETKKKIAESTRKARLGKTCSEEQRLKISESMKKSAMGRTLGEEVVIYVRGAKFDSVGAACKHFGVSRARIRQWVIAEQKAEIATNIAANPTKSKEIPFLWTK